MGSEGGQPAGAENKHPFYRFVLLIAGIIAASLGFAGIFVPLLPTTPFLLLASWCFVRSSRKANQWLLNNRFLGPYIENYKSGHGITLRNKIYSLAFLWVTIITSLLFSSGLFPSFIWYFRIGLFALGTIVTIHILRFNTLDEK